MRLPWTIEISVSWPIIVIGFLMSLYSFWQSFRIELTEEEKIFDLAFFTFFSSFFFGRVFYVAERSFDFNRQFDRMIHLQKFPGLNLWGLLAGAIVAIVYFSWKKKIPRKTALDHLASSVSLFLSFIFIVFFFEGIMIGQVNSTFGLYFPGYAGKRLPVQLFGVLIFLLFFLFSRKILQRLKLNDQLEKKAGGFIFWSFLTVFFSVLFLLEFIRRDRLYYEAVATAKYLFCIFSIISLVMTAANYGKFIKMLIKKKNL